MTIEMAIGILQNLILTSLMIITAILGAAVSIGLVVSLLQSVTSIQEQTLTFVPKLVGVGLMVMVSANWMVRNLMEVCIAFIQRIPEMAP